MSKKDRNKGKGQRAYKKLPRWLAMRPDADGFRKEDTEKQVYCLVDWEPVLPPERALKEVAYEIDGRKPKSAMEVLRKLYKAVQITDSGKTIYCRFPFDLDESCRREAEFEDGTSGFADQWDRSKEPPVRIKDTENKEEY